MEHVGQGLFLLRIESLKDAVIFILSGIKMASKGDFHVPSLVTVTFLALLSCIFNSDIIISSISCSSPNLKQAFDLKEALRCRVQCF